ncbi:hypothetical protein TcCL_ESM01089 [Trypanosoma cruzi]|uniref:Ubiquitin-like domain-containing protein n=2 Tax=Trypanosoma cruzi TaxID=5693 RepID=Q4CML6_TRYCC|nr:hypothetical protein, conserved [Trypanosoma cruzi]EAN81520.1 hypothetical protein, conserved [Trypanosoma cruzi]RNC61323.1 hypothetical protein TcCL_ESM01089 [Trypanosoma cruzi]|eukprot:XP_802966.1 hypothetical protein [Trypanosoma cruzi strain CL Brener]
MSNTVPPHYVRLRRQNLTIFLHCDVNHDTVQAIKERYEKLTGRLFYTVRLYLGRQSLDDFSTLYNCGIEHEGAELIVVHSKALKTDGTGEYIWEDLEEATQLPQPSREEAKETKEGGTSLGSREGGETAGEGGSASLLTRPEEKSYISFEPNVGFVGV